MTDAEMTEPSGRLTQNDRRLLVDLLALPTAGPLEAPHATDLRIWEAQRAYAAAADDEGFAIIHHAATDPNDVRDPFVPVVVRDAIDNHPGFLADQPNLVLRLGPPRSRRATVMLNVHIDTVAGDQPARFDGSRFHGRGAIDAKGPAVALLAGVRTARQACPAIGTEVSVVIQVVSGEEGGAMGVFGTRTLVNQGHIGALNVFCEPTSRQVLMRSTASMTARIRVSGCDAIDDDPGAGHNASVLLGFLAQHLALQTTGFEGGAVCIAGLHTGDRHNRVYGSGQLLVNLSYESIDAGQRAESALASSVLDGVAAFRERFGGTRDFARTAADATTITRLEWLKRGLPVLSEDSRGLAARLASEAGLPFWPAQRSAFTCDAIWLDGEPTMIFGPGDLAANHAHADGEFADLGELEQYARDLAALLVSFAEYRKGTEWA